MSCAGSCRRSSAPALLWLWGRPAAATVTRPLAWERPQAADAALKRRKNKNKTNKKKTHLYMNVHSSQKVETTQKPIRG